MLDCGGGLLGSTNAVVEWDVQPYDLGFQEDLTPDFATLLAEPISSRDPAQLAKCAVVITIQKTGGDGERHFYAPHANSVGKRPQLELIYDAPTSAAQLAWSPDRSCDVMVSVPVPISTDEICEPVNAASNLLTHGTQDCPYMQLTATAATTLESCAMVVNGVNLFADCNLNNLVVGRDGVCVVQLDAAMTGFYSQPRAACFDTQTQGVGMEELVSWIDNLQQGATAMVVSCSRLAWRYNRAQLGSALATLGALNSPTHTDDAYALVGTKGASSPLAEARTACCDNPDPVCLTCDQTPAIATVITKCNTAMQLSELSALGPESFFGGFGSESHVAAVGALTSSSSRAQTGGSDVSAGGIASFQAADVDVLDATCATALATNTGDVYGAALATDGDTSTYWLSSGTRDAILTIDLGAKRQLINITFDWESPAYSVLVLYSAASFGDSWNIGGTLNELEALYANPPRSPRSFLTLSDGGANAAIGVLARRLRVYMADPTNGTAPVFALRELNIQSCARSELAIMLDTQLAYEVARTPTVTSIAPKRGSTAGGTLITLQVDGLPSGTGASDVTVTVVGLSCIVQTVSGAAVSCLTSSYGKTSAANPGNGPVRLTLPAIGTAASTGNATYEYIDLWTRYTTWGGEYVVDWQGQRVRNTIPGLETSGDSIWIQTGQRILLDCDIKVYMLIVQGVLEFDRKDIRLDANYIFVMGGSFVVGTEEEPFLQQAIITLFGSPTSQEIPV